MKDMWEQRYAADEYAYGEEPNASSKARQACAASEPPRPRHGPCN